MPGVNYHPGNGGQLAQILAGYGNRIRALETQQQMVLSNLQGQPIMALGLQPGSNPAEWGLGLLRQTFRGRAAFFGETSTGTTAVRFYAADGQTVLAEVSDVGLQVRNPSTGVMTRVSPPQESFVGSELSTTSTSYATLGGPMVTVTVSAAGRALVLPSAIIGIGGAATTSTYWQGIVGVELDGFETESLLAASTTTVTIGGTRRAVGIQATCSNSYMWNNLSAGSHRFRLVYKSTLGQTVHFSFNSLIVIPY